MVCDFVVRQVAVALIITAAGLQAAQVVDATDSQLQTVAVTTNRAITPQSRQFVLFESQGVYFSSDFDGGRFSGVESSEPGVFKVRVEAENYPVNDSTWYAFRIWGESNRTVKVQLHYKGGPHRYTPKISRNRVDWEPINAKAILPARSKDSFSFELNIGKQPLYVAGQELFTTIDYEKWMSRLTKHAFVKRTLLGKSPLGKPIYMMDITEAEKGPDSVLIIGRQHPPELTGAMALREFVETLCGDSGLASDFRKQFKVRLVPILNPDGVDAGHWRHNHHGTDLNRDWGQFNQPETQLVRDLVQGSRENLRFALDFHSTRSDVLYMSHPVSKTPKDMSWLWLKDFHQQTIDRKTDAEHSMPKEQTLSFAPWIARTLNIPAVTYEVGDKTDRDLIRQVAQKAAQSMMSTLLSQVPVRQTADLRIALYKGPGTGGKGPPSILKYFDSRTNVVVTEVSPTEIRNGILRHFDVVIFAGGSGSKQAEMIGDPGKREVREFIQNGGGYVGICAGAYLATAGFSWGLGLLDAETVSPKWQRGVGDVQLELTELGRQSLADKPGQFAVHYANGPIVKPAGNPALDDYEILALYRTELAKHGSPEGVMVNSPAILRGRLGQGRVICFSPHPEQTAGLESFIESGILWAAGR